MAVNGIKEGIKDKCNIDTNRSAKILQKENSQTDRIQYEDLLSSAGEFGKYQVLLFLSTFPFYIFSVFVYYTQLFMTETSSHHWCWVPELANLTDLERRSLAIPPDSNTRYGYSHCQTYDANWTEVLQSKQKPDRSWNTIPCQHGWEFNKSEIPYDTITSDLGWVCERDSYQANAQAIFFLGCGAGGFLIGWISDRFGRLPALVSSNLIGGIGGFLSTFSRNFMEFAICRFITGMAYDNCMMMAYLIVLEYVAPKYRTMLSNLSFALFYSVGVTAIPWIAIAAGHWKTLSLVTSLPMGLSIFALFILPESPRWLLSKGRVDQAVEKILTIGRYNKKEVPAKLIDEFKSSAPKNMNEESGSVLEILKRPSLRKMFIYVCMLYILCSIVFDGLVRSIGQLDFDFFVSFSVISFTEFPSMLVVAFIMDWLGRRWLVTFTMMLSCVFSILTVFVGSGLSSVLCAVVARFCVNMAYSAVMQWSAEMMPTSVRGSAASIVHICGYLASILTPYIIYLETYIYWIPLVIIGCIAGSSTVFGLLLPETAHKDMPQSFEDAELLVKSQKYWDMPFLKKKANCEEEEKTGHVNRSFDE